MLRRFDHWSIAYRNARQKNFKIIPSPSYGWTADPFLVEYEGRMYLFAEIFLAYSERNGIIGYCVYDEKQGGWSPWTVSMDRHWHLSYPNVFVYRGRLCMIPESWQLGEIALYELEAFPDKWKKVHILAQGDEYCDSTIMNINGSLFLYTYIRQSGFLGGDALVFRLDENLNAYDARIVSSDPRGARCGGKVIYRKNRNPVRVGQDCSLRYGGGLVFYEIIEAWSCYREKEIKYIGVSDLRLSWRRFCGIHTYNRCGDFEVIDLCRERISLAESIASKRVRKIFTNKY